MTTQLATQAPGQPMGHTSHVAGSAYVYDIEHRTGLAIPTIALQDVAAADPIKLGVSSVCAVATGACVASVTGGVVAGYDMYGQYLRETVAPAGTSKAAFASVVSGPADLKWANAFGLPYKYIGAAAVPNANVTITPSASDGDARGTFVYAGSLDDPVEVVVPYRVDTANVFGAPYSLRLVAPGVNTVTVAVTGTVASTGVVTITMPAVVAGRPTGVTLTFPDGHTVRGALGGAAVVHTLTQVWMAQYGRAIRNDATALLRLVAVAFDAAELRNTYATLTGTVEPSPVEPEPEPTDPNPNPWDAFTTHAQINDWMQHFIEQHDLELPDGWDGMTISEKKAFLNANVDPTP